MGLERSVIEAFTSRLKESLEGLGLKVVQPREENRLSVVCPLACGDTNGSATIFPERANMHCFQCGAAMELKEWAAVVLKTTSPYDTLFALAGKLDVKVHKPKPTAANVTAETVPGFEAALWQSEAGRPFRQLLADRPLSDKELIKYQLGLVAAHGRHGVFFPQYEEDGQLLGGGPIWTNQKGRKWTWWPTGRCSSKRFWPLFFRPREDTELWICEGPWDDLIAREKLNLDAYAWLGGAGVAITSSCIPGFFRNRVVNICFDLDVFRGPGLPVLLPQDQKKLFEQSIPALQAAGCKVKVRVPPLDIAKFPKGDVRDWWNQGGRDITTFLSFDPSVYVRQSKPVVETTIDQLGHFMGEDVRFRTMALSMEPVGYSFPAGIYVRCDMPGEGICDHCLLYREYGEHLLDLKKEPEIMGQLLSGHHPMQFAVKKFLQPPRKCPGIAIEEVGLQGQLAIWTAGPTLKRQEDHHRVTIIAPHHPDAVKEMEVSGRVLRSLDSAETMVFAREMKTCEREKANLAGHVEELEMLTPWQSEDPEEIVALLERRGEDLAYNVTQTFDMPWGLGVDLLAHSALELPTPSGQNMRGWLDMAFVGPTATAKTQTVLRMLEHLGVGSYHAVGSNATLAGITTATSKDVKTGSWVTTPGLLPRSDGGLVALDEFQVMEIRGRTGAAFFEDFNSVRQNGTLDVMKAGRELRFPARIRMLTISNPPSKHGFDVYRQPCEVLRDLYGKEQTIRRLDLAWILTVPGSEGDFQGKDRSARIAVPHKWTKELAHLLVLRAWGLKPEDIMIEEEAWVFALETTELWSTEFSTKALALFNGLASRDSLLRMATAAANLCFSHPVGHPERALVCKAHVAVAAAHIRDSWIKSGYDMLSLAVLAPEPARYFSVEYLLTAYCLSTHELQKISNLSPMPRAKGDLAAIIGIVPNNQILPLEAWVSEMLAAKGLREEEAGHYSFTDVSMGISEAYRTKLENGKDTLEDWFAGRRKSLDAQWKRDRGDREASMFSSTELAPLAGCERFL